ncbi:MAG: DNA repair protein RecO [Candidatus Gottesmanbacteria bacterium]|nr:DNA repair protein RecO [Candidatus Gottesmanbacteria bacterium]
MRAPRLYTAEGIILKRKNVGEADRILTIFTKHYGKVRVLARGVRKVSSKRAPHVEVFNRVIATLHKGSGMDTLTEVSPVASYDAIRRDLARVGAAYYLCELIDGLLPEAQVHEDVFMLLCDAFAVLATVKKERIEVLRERFAAALLRALGFLERGKKPPTGSLDSYVEQLLERHLKTVRLASHFNI